MRGLRLPQARLRARIADGLAEGFCGGQFDQGRRGCRHGDIQWLFLIGNIEGTGCHVKKNIPDRECNRIAGSCTAPTTDAIAALGALSHCDCPERAPALEAFYAKWKHEPLAVDKWLAIQAGSRLAGTLAEVQRLARHEAFDVRNPNKVYALIGGFRANQVRFHVADGSGYEFLAAQVIALDAMNPQVAARMARGFDRWRKFDAGRQSHARAALERIRGVQGLSKDVLEIVTRALA